MKNLIYSIFRTEDEDFQSALLTLTESWSLAKPIIRINIFAAIFNNEDYVRKYNILKDHLFSVYPSSIPTFSLIAQAPLASSLVAEVQYFDGELDELRYDLYANVPYVVYENEQVKSLYISGVQSDVINVSFRQQSVDVFNTIAAVFEKEGFGVCDIVRQWNYLERIVDFENEYQHYQAFNDARTAFYATGQWSEGYPAATGIGMQSGGVIVDIDAIKYSKDVLSIVPIDNQLQIAAHEYSKRLLISEVENKTTPKFERAKAVDFVDDGGVIYISGTAAIRGEESLHNATLKEQLVTTVENIEYLIGDENLNHAGMSDVCTRSYKLLRVYLKHDKFVTEAKELLQRMFPSLPMSFLLADVCRDELLIEIEGIATY
ncbi:MAG TPA: endoribonuclease L-PSP [Porphyromonadaceae bacterium]|nr:endoribonuclease L-PSP [Porphyromonadaceae bacterium]